MTHRIVVFRSLAMRAAVAGCAALALGCGDSVTAPVHLGTPVLRIVGGAAASDTVGATLADSLEIEVVDSAGHPFPGLAVQYRAAMIPLPFGQSTPQLSVTTPYYGAQPYRADTLDAHGRSRTSITLGARAGAETLYVAVPEIGALDTIVYAAKPGKPAIVRFTPRDTAVLTGGSLATHVTLTDRLANPTPGTVQLTPLGSVTAVDGAGVATLGAPGLGTIVANVGALSDTLRVEVVPHGTIAVVEDQGDGWSGISTVGLDGSGKTRLTRSSDGVWMPGWSADGASILYSEGPAWAGGRLYRVTLGGVRTRLIASPPDTVKGELYPESSADGQWIYFTAITPSPYDPGNLEHTGWRVRSDGTGVAELVRTVDQSTQGWGESPSPDGTTVVLDREGILFLVDLTTNDDTSLSALAGIPQNQSGGLMPHFSPDGKTIVYEDASYGGGPLYVVGVDGSGWRRLNQKSYPSLAGFSWSPDGQWIVVRGDAMLDLIRVSDGMTMSLPFSAAMRQPAFKP